MKGIFGKYLEPLITIVVDLNNLKNKKKKFKNRSLIFYTAVLFLVLEVEFKPSTPLSCTRNRGISEDVARRIKCGWMKWEEAIGVLCDKKELLKVQGKFIKLWLS